MEDNTIKHLAYQYFSGTISKKDESTLFEYLRSSGEHMEEFRKWERAWKENLPEDITGLENVEQFHDKVQTTFVNGEISRYRKKLSITNWAYVFTSILLLMILGGSLTLHSKKDNAGEFALAAPAGGKCQATLPDETQVWLNAGSTLWIPGSFNKTDRQVKLSGEAYFEVFHDEKNLFIVDADNCSVTVRGTKFNVSAYPEDATISTSVIEGMVDFANSTAVVRLEKGQVANMSKASNKIQVSTSDSESAKAWTENRVEYKNITLNELARIIERKYGVKIVLQAEQLSNEKFNISLRNNESINDVLNALVLIVPVKVKTEGDTIYIK